MCSSVSPHTESFPSDSVRHTLVHVALLLIAAAVPGTSASERVGTVSGTVVDGLTGKGIAGAAVVLSGADAADTTDSTGAFILDSVPVGFWDLQVAADSYRQRLIPSWQVKVGRNREAVIELEREEQVQQLDRMVVRAGRLAARTASQSTSMLRLSRDEILSAPGAAQDIAQVLQAMPSVEGAAHEGFTRLLVRGGDEDENALLVDDIEVQTLSHWANPYEPGGGVSILHPDYVASVDFFAGGVPVTYPPLLSAVTDVRFREGSLTHRTWQVDLNIGGFGFFLEGPIVRDRASYILNARVGVTYLVSMIAGLGGYPEYQNGQAKLVWNLGSRDKLVGNLLVGHERLTMESDDGPVSDRHYNDGTHVAGGVQWRRQMGWGANRLLLSTVWHGIVWDDVWADSIRDAATDLRRLNAQLKDDLKVFVRDRDLLSAGLAVEAVSYNEDRVVDPHSVWADTVDSTYHVYGSYPDTAGRAMLLLVPPDSEDIEQHDLGWRIGAWLNYALQLGPVKVNGGVRDDYFTLWRAHGVSPRLSASVDIGSAGALSLSAGLYRQPPAKFSWLADSAGLWDIPLQRLYQTALGFEGQVRNTVAYGAETYLKYYDREPVYHLVSAGDPRHPDAGWRQTALEPDNHGRKRAYGLELYVQKKKLDLFYYQAAYALMRAEREYDGGAWYEDDNCLHHSASLVLGSNFHRSHRISMRFDVSEGFPYTPLDMAASVDLAQTTYNIGDGWNGRRRAWRFKLNLRYDLTLYLRHANIVLYLEGYNLLNQRDIAYEYYTFGERWPGGTRTEVLSRSILPGLGLYVTF